MSFLILFVTSAALAWALPQTKVSPPHGSAPNIAHSVVFTMQANLPNLGLTGFAGQIVPYNGQFFAQSNILTSEYCPGKCPPHSTPSYVLDASAGDMALNTSVTNSEIFGKAQEIYVDYTGALRFFIPPQFIIEAPDQQYGAFGISKGGKGKNDTLTFNQRTTGKKLGPAAFYLCKLDSGLAKPNYPVFQVFLGIPGFKVAINQDICTKFVPQVSYTNLGAYEWL